MRMTGAMDADDLVGQPMEGSRSPNRIRLRFRFPGGLQVDLQRIRDIATFGLVAAEQAKERKLEVPGAFFHISPARDKAMDFETARTEFKRWVLTSALRDSVEAVSDFLEEARRICFVYSLGAKRLIRGDEWTRGMIDKSKWFHEQGLPDKIDHLADKFDASLRPEISADLLSINKARNCLVHRKGVVSQKDLNTTEGLLVKWRKIELVVSGNDGERIMDSKARVNRGESISTRVAGAEKLFRKGEAILFSADELTQLCLTLWFFGQQLVEAVGKYGRATGCLADDRKS